MKNRVGILAGGITFALLLTGIAWAAQSSGSSSDDPTSSTVTTLTTSPGSSTSTTESRESETETEVETETEAAETENEVADHESEAVDAESKEPADDSEDDVTSSTAPNVAIPTGPITYDLEGAGSVTVVFANGAATIGSINPAAGWTVDESEESGREIEVKLTNGNQEVELKVEIEDGQVKVRIERETKD